MCCLSVLEISQFCNLTKVNILPSPLSNIIYGENGSGKTSLLEAIYHLSLGRFFRTRYFNRIIQNDREKFFVFGKFSSAIPVGLERSRKRDLKIRIAKKDVHSVSDLASLLPLQLINPDGYKYKLINAGPKVRRQFMSPCGMGITPSPLGEHFSII